jgi:hypothetical protein
LTRRIGIGPIVEFGPFVSRTHLSKGQAPMLWKFAVAMIATTMLVAPALAADKPAATTPGTPAASTATPTVVNSGKDAKAGGKTGLKSNKAAGTAPAAEVKTIKADKNLKVTAGKNEVKATDKNVGAAPTADVKSATDKTVKTAVHHRKHSHHWYMVHRGRHPGHILASKGSIPVKHVHVHRPHQETGQQLVKTNRDASGKAAQ